MSSRTGIASGARSVRPWFVKMWAVARLSIGVAVAAATVEQARLALTLAAANGRDPVDTLARLFTFFTVLSNTIFAVVIVIAAVRALTTAEAREPRGLAILLAWASTYMLITGIVYNVVLRSAGGTEILGGWSNTVHHVIGPLFVLVDVLAAPRRRRLAWRAAGGALAFPLGWVAFVLASGPTRTSPATGAAPWYPYPFLDPAVVGGYPGVLLWVLGIAALIAAVAAGVIGVGRFRDRTA